MQPKISLGETSIRAYGRTFDFPPKGHPDHYRLRDEAHQKATAYAEQLLKTMEQQKGAKLSTREAVTGVLDRAPEPRPVEHNRPAERHPDVSPYAARIAELSRQSPKLPADRALRARKLEKLQQLENDWQQNRQIEKMVEAHDFDPKVATARQHSQFALEHVRLDPRATPAEVAERQRLHDLVNVPFSDPADYWTQASEADKQWFSRLDAIAAEKKAAVTAAQSEAAAARGEARAARKTELGAEPVGETVAEQEQQQPVETPAV
ncbi:MAG TPA: hypothetical protein VG826_05395 [Pirellulales bacterium]|nr:hypothetical protein [Pirellulales bacterium]